MTLQVRINEHHAAVPALRLDNTPILGS